MGSLPPSPSPRIPKVPTAPIQKPEESEDSAVKVRTTITLPQNLSDALIEFCHQNKMKHKGDTQQSQVIRKALEMYFKHLKVEVR